MDLASPPSLTMKPATTDNPHSCLAVIEDAGANAFLDAEKHCGPLKWSLWRHHTAKPSGRRIGLVIAMRTIKR